ncbi:MAG: hypothetical protein J0M04_22495 [Verrucomicrobia bacterium]|nr:hypothetical protein [Verrucomicrobiota bacterium]
MILAQVITLWDYIPQGLALLGFAASVCLLCGVAISGSRLRFARKWGVVFTGTAFVGGAGLFWQIDQQKQRANSYRRMVATREIHLIEQAAFAYFREVGSWPQGDNASVIRLLVEHEGQEAILPVRDLRRSDQGAALDPWGSPYYLEVSEQDGLKAHSLGPDRIDGTRDDFPLEEPANKSERRTPGPSQLHTP